jgi:hypothetical protein
MYEYKNKNILLTIITIISIIRGLVTNKEIMKTVPFGESAETIITQMRVGNEFGTDAEQLVDGNMIPRLCQAVGANACAKACQLQGIERQEAGVLCAENNINTALNAFGVKPENFVLAAATHDNVHFADALSDTKAIKSPEGYTQVPETNAFFFRPDIDKLIDSQPVKALGMRMADCGSVNYEMEDREGNLVLGQAHFSRTNMRGPSAFMHELEGEKVSWSDYVLGNAIEHYGADPAKVKVFLSAAVEREDFVHHYENLDKMEAHFPGWNELGFMHPQGEENFDCLIDYREMIEWQLRGSAAKFDFTLKPSDLSKAVNTGDLSLGYASHHASTKGVIEHGRDLYMIKKQSGISDFDRAADLLVVNEVMKMPLEKGMPHLDADPFVALYEVRMGHAAPPRQLWDTRKNRITANEEGFHPMTYWLMDSEVPADPELRALYDQWMRDISGF